MLDEASTEQLKSQIGGGEDRYVTVVRGTHGWHSLELRSLWEFRELLVFLIWRDITTRYRQTALGPLWVILKPVIGTVVFSMILGSFFSGADSDNVPYPIFTFAGQSLWYMFTGAAIAATASLNSGMGMISRVYFPRLIMPLVAICQAIEDFIVYSLILAGLIAVYHFMGWWHIAPRLAVLAAPLYVLLGLMFAMSIGLWLAGIAVRFRDVTLGLGYILNAAIFLSPVLYSTVRFEKHPKLLLLFLLNPATTAIQGLRWAVLGTPAPDVFYAAVTTAFVLVLFVTGLYNFRASERSIVDVR